MYRDYFDSVESLLEHVVNAPMVRTENKSRTGTPSFTGTDTWEEALKLAKEGWLEGVNKVEKFSSQFTNLLGSMLQIDDYFYDVTGQDFDLDRVLRGEPEAWLNSEQVHVEAPALQTIKLVANITISGGNSIETLITRGAAIAALVILLEKARRRVEVEIVWTASDLYESRMLLKQAGQDLDIAKIAYWLIHPSAIRRMMFASLERCKDRRIANVYGYGSPTSISENKGDIYVDGLYGCFGQDDAVGFIKEALKSQGIELKEGE